MAVRQLCVTGSMNSKKMGSRDIHTKNDEAWCYKKRRGNNIPDQQLSIFFNTSIISGFLVFFAPPMLPYPSSYENAAQLRVATPPLLA